VAAAAVTTPAITAFARRKQPAAAYMFVQKEDTAKQAHDPWTCVAAPTKPILNLYLSENFENGKESRISRIKSFHSVLPARF
jgi:hypothetical protein